MAITTLNNLSINRSDTAAADQLWTATSAVATDFQAPAGGGKILQFVAISDNTEYANNTGTTPTAVQGTDADLVITPAAATSRILVSYDWGAISSYTGSNLGYGKIMYDVGGAGYNDVLPVGRQLWVPELRRLKTRCNYWLLQVILPHHLLKG